MVALLPPRPDGVHPRLHHAACTAKSRSNTAIPSLEPIFKETYGIPIYQEQIMRAAVELAGYTALEADDLRKAISKKKADEIDKAQAEVHQRRSRNAASPKTPPRPSSPTGKSSPATASTKPTPPITG